jgi:hypothetical protein
METLKQHSRVLLEEFLLDGVWLHLLHIIHKSGIHRGVLESGPNGFESKLRNPGMKLRNCNCGQVDLSVDYINIIDYMACVIWIQPTTSRDPRLLKQYTPGIQ